MIVVAPAVGTTTRVNASSSPATAVARPPNRVALRRTVGPDGIELGRAGRLRRPDDLEAVPPVVDRVRLGVEEPFGRDGDVDQLCLVRVDAEEARSRRRPRDV